MVKLFSVLVTQSCLTLFCDLTRFLCPWNYPGKNIGVCSHSLLQKIFLTQGSYPSLLHCRKILWHLSIPNLAVVGTYSVVHSRKYSCVVSPSITSLKYTQHHCKNKKHKWRGLSISILSTELSILCFESRTFSEWFGKNK